MMFRLILGLAVVANIGLMLCEAQNDEASAESSATATAETSTYASSYSRSKIIKKKCRKEPRCPRHEEYSSCPNSITRPLHCSEKDRPYRVPVTDETSKGACVCKRNYLRAQNGTCIPEDQCELTCGPDEVLDDCPMNCDSEYCPTSDEDIVCTMPTNEECPPPACKCGFNRRRAPNGSCILTRDCPPYDCSALPNQEYNACPPLCPTDDCSQATPTGECPRQFGNILIILPCNPKCRCVEGFWRLNGTCVPYGQCPGVCPINERYSGCLQAACRPVNCTQKGKRVPCPRINSRMCKKGCMCNTNFLRAKNGTCVPEDQCKTGVCPANERYSECKQAECRALNCTQKDKPIACPRIDPSFCEEGCVCNEGYLRAKNGTCVLEDQCDTNGCGKNEEFSDCTQILCRAQECTEKDQPIACPSIVEGSCIEGCVCKTGFLRDEDGNCIPEEQCTPNPCQPNQEWSDCIEGVCRPQQCSERGEPIPCPNIIGEYCTAGCVCKEGYLRSEYDYEVCIPEDQCQSNTCPLNEEYVPCIIGVCRAMNCSQRGQDVPCADLMPGQECDGGCICKENFLRAKNGTCIPENQCEPTCGENEVLDTCPASCSSDYCPTSADEKKKCVKSESCQPACKCRFNYRRAKNGTCIPTRQCPPFDCSDRPNEEYVSCPALCPTDGCSLPWVRKRCPFRIGIILECNPKCQCKDGYGRVNGICTPFELCPNLCPKNEKYSPCIQDECQPEKCEDRDVIVESYPEVDEATCKKGCVCQNDYFRNGTGQCISYDECGGPLCPNWNEYYTKTMVDCPPNTCESLVSKYNCGVQEEKPGCMCDPGYLRLDSKPDSPCVPICDCPQMKDSPDC